VLDLTSVGISMLQDGASVTAPARINLGNSPFLIPPFLGHQEVQLFVKMHGFRKCASTACSISIPANGTIHCRQRRSLVPFPRDRNDSNTKRRPVCRKPSCHVQRQR